ncbi:MAG: carboxypeptidase-like regulatory domain-containing protein [Bacteroidota bacterium]
MSDQGKEVLHDHGIQQLNTVVYFWQVRKQFSLKTRAITIITLLLITHAIGFCQTGLFRGLVRDELTLKPLRDVNIKVYGTTRGTATDQAGNFSLAFNRLPATLVFSCVGYEIATYDISTIPDKPVEFLIRSKSYMLGEVDISSRKYSFLFKDKDYSVLDYELLGDNILLLIFRYQLKRAEMVMINRNGDTLAISKLPETPPASLFKDFLANVHYFSKAKNAYQCFYNDENQRIKNAKLIQQIDLQKKESTRWELLNKLIGSEDGSKFRVFAQSITMRRLVGIANNHLARISGRYQLSVQTDEKLIKNLELDVVDLFQGNNVRPMDTLSGGETFLVSLALALALSDMAGKDNRVESLFIDEGFGTLDPLTLDMAIAALDNLQSGGKTVGIISHVGLLKERIPCQVQVNKMGGGVSEIKVV